jgi:dCMP deaminase
MITIQDKKYLKILDKLEFKSTCLRAHVGAIAVKNDKILIKAVNHPPKFYNLKKLGCIRDKMHIKSGTRREISCCLCAEQYLIAHAAKKGISLKGATMYVSKHPCRVCEGLIVEAGFKRVVYQESYPDPIKSISFFQNMKIKVEQDSANEVSASSAREH